MNWCFLNIADLQSVLIFFQSFKAAIAKLVPKSAFAGIPL